MKSSVNYLKYILPSKMATLGIVSFIIFGLVSSLIIDSSIAKQYQNLQATENNQPTSVQQVKPLDKVVTQEAKDSTSQFLPPRQIQLQITAKTNSSSTVIAAREIQSCKIGEITIQRAQFMQAQQFILKYLTAKMSATFIGRI